MWALAGHSGAAAVSAASLQERFAARKAADLAQQAALAALKSECQTRDLRRTNSCKTDEVGDVSDAQLQKLAVDGASTSCSVSRLQQSCLQSSRQGTVASQAAMRVEALREELVAAEATVLELKGYLAEAEVDLQQEQRQMNETALLLLQGRHFRGAY